MQTSHAWLAGIVDGEGCLTLFMKKNDTGTKSVTANITITNSSAAIIDRCVTLFDAECVKYTFVKMRDSRNPNGRPLRRLSVRNYDAILRLLDMIEPFLVGKSEQARLVREFASQAKVRRALSTDDREWYYDEVRRLNRVGDLIP